MAEKLLDPTGASEGYFGTPVEESLIQQILHHCDFVVAGIGD